MSNNFKIALERFIDHRNWHKDDDSETYIHWEWTPVEAPPFDEALLDLAQLREHIRILREALEEIQSLVHPRGQIGEICRANLEATK